jgi:hypothetical protein
MVYEFWDMRSNNLIDAFGSEHEALLALRKAIQEEGERIVEFLMLIEDDPETDENRVIGIGLDLLDRAKHAA